MKLSLITVTKNVEDSVDELAHNINSQNYVDMQHIIKDAESIDKTVERFRELPNDIQRKVIVRRDSGIYDALNQAATYCEGEVIGMLHAGDQFADPGILRLVMQKFEDPSLDYCYGNVSFTSQKKNGVIRFWRSSPVPPAGKNLCWMPPHTSLFVRRRVFQTIGYYSTKFRISGDFDFILRLRRCDQLRGEHIDATLIKMKAGGISDGGIRSRLVSFSEDWRVLTEHTSYPTFWALKKRLGKIPQLRIV